jgi:RNA polymerase sigma-70 factor (ECF subfamily)
LSTFERGRNGGFRGWLYGITRHKLADHFRRRELTQPLLSDGDIAAVLLAQRDHSLEGDIEDMNLLQPDDLTVVLHAALNAIRDDFDAHNWEAFERTVLRGEAAVDVAANLNLTAVAVRQAKFRILQRLRRELEGD